MSPQPHEYPGLEVRMRTTLQRLKEELPPDLGFMVFVMHLGQGGGFAYGGTIERHSALRTTIEWLYRVGLSEAPPRTRALIEQLYKLSRVPGDADYEAPK